MGARLAPKRPGFSTTAPRAPPEAEATEPLMLLAQSASERGTVLMPMAVARQPTCGADASGSMIP